MFSHLPGKLSDYYAVSFFTSQITAAIQFLCDNYKSHQNAYTFKDANASIKYMQTIYKWFNIHDILRCYEQKFQNENK